MENRVCSAEIRTYLHNMSDVYEIEHVIGLTKDELREIRPSNELQDIWPSNEGGPMGLRKFNEKKDAQTKPLNIRPTVYETLPHRVNYNLRCRLQNIVRNQGIEISIKAVTDHGHYYAVFAKCENLFHKIDTQKLLDDLVENDFKNIQNISVGNEGYIADDTLAFNYYKMDSDRYDEVAGAIEWYKECGIEVTPKDIRLKKVETVWGAMSVWELANLDKCKTYNGGV